MEEKKPAASPDPAEQVEELLAQARQTAAGRVSRREMDAILESVRSQDAPEPSGAKRVRQGKSSAGRTGPDPGAGTGRAQPARTAPPDGPAVFRGDVPDPDPVGRGIRGSVGGGELPPGGNGQPAHPGVFRPAHQRRGSRSPSGEAAPDPEQTARLAWLADRLEPFLLPRGLRITVRALLGGRLLLDWL